MLVCLFICSGDYLVVWLAFCVFARVLVSLLVYVCWLICLLIRSFVSWRVCFHHCSCGRLVCCVCGACFVCLLVCLLVSLLACLLACLRTCLDVCMIVGLCGCSFVCLLVCRVDCAFVVCACACLVVCIALLGLPFTCV